MTLIIIILGTAVITAAGVYATFSALDFRRRRQQDYLLEQINLRLKPDEEEVKEIYMQRTVPKKIEKYFENIKANTIALADEKAAFKLYDDLHKPDTLCSNAMLSWFERCLERDAEAEEKLREERAARAVQAMNEATAAKRVAAAAEAVQRLVAETPEQRAAKERVRLAHEAALAQAREQAMAGLQEVGTRAKQATDAMQRLKTAARETRLEELQRAIRTLEEL